MCRRAGRVAASRSVAARDLPTIGTRRPNADARHRGSPDCPPLARSRLPRRREDVPAPPLPHPPRRAPRPPLARAIPPCVVTHPLDVYSLPSRSAASAASPPGFPFPKRDQRPAVAPPGHALLCGSPSRSANGPRRCSRSPMRAPPPWQATLRHRCFVNCGSRMSSQGDAARPYIHPTCSIEWLLRADSPTCPSASCPHRGRKVAPARGGASLSLRHLSLPRGALASDSRDSGACHRPVAATRQLTTTPGPPQRPSRDRSTPRMAR